jgi:hypothetical protein
MNMQSPPTRATTTTTTTMPPARATVIAARALLFSLRALLAALVLGVGVGAASYGVDAALDHRDDAARSNGHLVTRAGRTMLVHAKGEVCFFVDGRFVDKTTHGVLVQQ